LTHTLLAYWRKLLDGHHRISVARYPGVEWIDAYVTEFGGGVRLWDEGRDKKTA
jgi:hypothetical protein